MYAIDSQTESKAQDGCKMQNEDCTPSSPNSLLVISYTPRFLVEVHYTFSPKVQWTSKQLKSAYLDFQSFHRRSSKFPAEHLPLLLEWFTPFFIAIIIVDYAIILLNSFSTVFWVRSFYLSVNNIVVLYQFTVTCIEGWSVRSRKKGLKIAITSMFFCRRGRSRARKGWICERRCQVSVRLHVFAGLFCP